MEKNEKYVNFVVCIQKFINKIKSKIFIFLSIINPFSILKKIKDKDIEINFKSETKILNEKYKKLYIDDNSEINKENLLQIYLKYIETTEGTSNRRSFTNLYFYLAGATILTAIISYLLIDFSIKESIFSIFLCLIIISFSWIWNLTLKYYQRTNRAKFEIMKIISNKLIKTSVFDDEYSLFEILNEKETKFNDIEKMLPYVFGVIGFLFLVFNICVLIYLNN